jgi:hypothetical protein
MGELDGGKADGAMMYANGGGGRVSHTSAVAVKRTVSAYVLYGYVSGQS